MLFTFVRGFPLLKISLCSLRSLWLKPFSKLRNVSLPEFLRQPRAQHKREHFFDADVEL